MNLKIIEPLQSELTSMWVGLIKVMPLLVIALVVILITWIVALVVSRLLAHSLKRSNLRPSLVELFGTLTKSLVWTVGVLMAVAVVFPSLTPAKLLTALGLGSVAVGFAFKDIFENFFAGVLIMLRRPMRLGDYVECDGQTGRIENISLRETYIRQTDDQLVILPNRFLFQNPVRILTDHAVRRHDLVVGVAYDEDIGEAREVILGALEGLELVEQGRPVTVLASEFNSSSVDFVVHWWSGSTPADFFKSRDQVVEAIKSALDNAGIEIPFPYRTLTFKEPLTVEADSMSKQECQDGA